jgi:hypothetical protein
MCINRFLFSHLLFKELLYDRFEAQHKHILSDTGIFDHKFAKTTRTMCRHAHEMAQRLVFELVLRQRQQEVPMSDAHASLAGVWWSSFQLSYVRQPVQLEREQPFVLLVDKHKREQKSNEQLANELVHIE